MAAVEQAVPANVIAASLFARFRSRQDHTFAEKMLSAMRHKFGGHGSVRAVVSGLAQRSGCLPTSRS